MNSSVNTAWGSALVYMRMAQVAALMHTLSSLQDLVQSLRDMNEMAVDSKCAG